MLTYCPQKQDDIFSFLQKHKDSVVVLDFRAGKTATSQLWLSVREMFFLASIRELYGIYTGEHGEEYLCSILRVMNPYSGTSEEQITIEEYSQEKAELLIRRADFSC